MGQGVIGCWSAVVKRGFGSGINLSFPKAGIKPKYGEFF
jgi:hypothetical protein